MRRQSDRLIRWIARHAACNVFAGSCGAQPASRAPGSAVPTPDRGGFARCPSPTQCSLSLRSGCGICLRGCAAQGSPPTPSRGLWRPSNITRDYAHMSYVSGGGRAILARLFPRPRNQRYVKCPRSPAGCRCVLRTPGPGIFARLRGSAPGPSRAPPTLASGCGRFASFAPARSPTRPCACDHRRRKAGSPGMFEPSTVLAPSRVKCTACGRP